MVDASAPVAAAAWVLARHAPPPLAFHQWLLLGLGVLLVEVDRPREALPFYGDALALRDAVLAAATPPPTSD